MIEPWHELVVQSDASPRGFAAEIRVAPDSPWFDGHFPGRPVLPGVAILSMVFEMVKKKIITEEQAIEILGLTRPEGRAITDAEGATSSTTQYQEVPLDSL